MSINQFCLRNLGKKILSKIQQFLSNRKTIDLRLITVEIPRLLRIVRNACEGFVFVFVFDSKKFIWE